MNKQKIALIVAGLLILSIAVFLLFKTGVTTFTKEAKIKPIPDPLDVTLDFYSEWLEIVKSNIENPYESLLNTTTILSSNAKIELKEAKSKADKLDPFFCQEKTPEKIGAKVLFELDNKAEIIILDKTPSSTSAFSQAIVSLTKGETSWLIDNISCSSGEVAPESEFSFEQEGYLLKSLQAPYTSGNWHLVFEQNGVMGYVAPLIFTASSTCSVNGRDLTCDTNSLTEGLGAKVTGHMQEAGAEVIRLELR